MHIVQGRVQDQIVTRSGRHLTGVFFAHVLKDFDVQRFQVVQDSIDELDVSIIPGPEFGPHQLAYVEQKVQHYTGGELQARVRMTDHIPLSPSGKHRVTFSRVRGRYAGQLEDRHAR
jgi:phenylacetate-CoA ligase